MSPTLLETNVQEIGQDEAVSMLDTAAKRYLHISGSEFVQAWEEGRWPDPDSVPGGMRVAGLLPLLEQF
jgi:hypothetical protein